MTHKGSHETSSKKENQKPQDANPPGSGSEMIKTMKKYWKKFMSPKEEDGRYSFVHDLVIAIVVVMVIYSSAVIYTGMTVPVVVVESGSMQHDMDKSSLGVIDTGDIVLVKKTDSTGDITTWAEGKGKDYETYGEYGDVIIYDKNGKGGTPVIHRAIVFIRHNETVGTEHYFDVPEWNIYHNSTIKYYIEELRLKIDYEPPRGHDGYLTKGDNKITNPRIDQESGIRDIDNIVVEQVHIDWVIGVARGEIPWFGLIKLKANDNEHIDTAPDNSWTNLKISLVLMIGLPITLNVLWVVYAHKYGVLEEENEKDKKKSGDTTKGKKQLSSRSEKIKLGKR